MQKSFTTSFTIQLGLNQDTQRKAGEITDAAKSQAQEITDSAEVNRTKTMSQVNAEVEQTRTV